MYFSIAWIYAFFRLSLFSGRNLPAALEMCKLFDAAESLKVGRTEIWSPEKFLVLRFSKFMVFADAQSRQCLVASSMPTACLFEPGNFCVDWAAALPSTSDLVQVGSFLLPFSAWQFPAVALFQSVSLVLLFSAAWLIFRSPWVFGWLLKFGFLRCANFLFAGMRLLQLILTPWFLVPLYFSAFSAISGFSGCLAFFFYLRDICLVLAVSLVILANPQSVEFRKMRAAVRERDLAAINIGVAEVWGERPAELLRLSDAGFLAVSSILAKSGALPVSVVSQAVRERLKLQGLLNLSFQHYSEDSETARSLLN